jgi:type II secretory pathway component PulK
MSLSRQPRRGVALMLVLWILVVLAGVALRVTSATRAAGDLHSNLRARTAARYAAESGVVAAVATMQRALERAGESAEQRALALNNPLRTLHDVNRLELGDARAQVVVIDASARVDINASPVDVLEALFTRVGDPSRAATTARAIRRHIDATPGQAQLFASLEEAAEVEGVDASLLRAAAPYLTVDGDGQINQRAASALVRSVARGGMIEEPSRLVIVSRGWQQGHPLTHEIQAVYAVQGNQLAFVRWRERDL